jgi:mannitol 2-dehydrogenase
MTSTALQGAHPSVPQPDYDRDDLTVGIAHFGLGNFHRAHQAMFVDRLLSLGEARDWAICGIGVLPRDVNLRDSLARQDHLYTLALRDHDELDARIIGSIRGDLLAFEDREAVLALLTAPTTRIVSLTITEGGYPVDVTTGRFEAPPADDNDSEQKSPTVFGLIVEALRCRREDGTVPFTVMSCDNLPDNGRIARSAVLGTARRSDPDLASWIEATVAFPNSMVDRITPVTTDADRRLVAERFGIADECPVIAEPFVQWVLEDTFPAGRPAFETVGVQLVDDVTPYELMKLRLLNASHQALAYAGLLLGYEYVHDAASDPDIAAYVRGYMDEATPTLAPVPGIDIDDYKATLLHRFGNPGVRDTLDRLATDASDRIRTFVLPTVRANIALDSPTPFGAALLATWARYSEGVDESGRRLSIHDPRQGELAAAAETQDARTFLRTSTFADLGGNEDLTGAVATALGVLQSRGTRALLRELVEQA